MLNAILMLKLWQTDLEHEYASKMNKNTHRERLEIDRERLVSNEIQFIGKLSKQIEVLLDGCSKSVTCQTLLSFVLFFQNPIAFVISVLLRSKAF